MMSFSKFELRTSVKTPTRQHTQAALRWMRDRSTQPLPEVVDPEQNTIYSRQTPTETETSQSELRFQQKPEVAGTEFRESDKRKVWLYSSRISIELQNSQRHYIVIACESRQQQSDL